MIIVAAPPVDDDLGFLERTEDLAIEKFVAQSGIEALDVAVLPRASWRDVGRLCTEAPDPLLNRFSDELRLPRWNGRSWFPYRPSLYLPYAQRQRWMRTSNDAFLTAHVDLSSDIRQRFRSGRRGYAPQDLLKASTFGDSFHPTAEGQAAIADAVLPTARKVIRLARPDG